MDLVVKVIIIIVYLAVVAFLGVLGWRKSDDDSTDGRRHERCGDECHLLSAN